jgi:hypothetical protein
MGSIRKVLRTLGTCSAGLISAGRARGRDVLTRETDNRVSLAACLTSYVLVLDSCVAGSAGRGVGGGTVLAYREG